MEYHPALGELVNVGRLDPFLAVTSKFTVAQIIGHQQHNVWSLSLVKLPFFICPSPIAADDKQHEAAEN